MKTTHRAKPTSDPTATERALPLEDIDPPKYFVLPENLSEEAEIITLAHPRLLTPSRYYFCPETGIYEFKRITAPPSTYRSWLVVPERRDDDFDVTMAESAGKVVSGDCSLEKGYVSKIAELFIATPIDPLFLILPALSLKPTTSRSDATGSLFLSADDLFERLFDVSKHFRHAMENRKTQKLFNARLETVCDAVDAGEEQMYRLNNEKLLAELVGKARNMVSSGLPSSMEEKFVKRALDSPIVTLQRQESSTSEGTQGAKRHGKEGQPTLLVNSDSQPTPVDSTAINSQTSADSHTTDSRTTADTAITAPDQPSEPDPSPNLFVAPEPPPDIVTLLRLRVAMTILLSTYIPPHVSTTLSNLLTLPVSPIDFTPLDAHLADLAKLRAEAVALQSIMNHGHKRNLEEDEVAGQDMADKKRKKEEDEKKKKAESKGIKGLRKVDTSGMKKMSDFFKKKAG